MLATFTASILGVALGTHGVLAASLAADPSRAGSEGASPASPPDANASAPKVIVIDPHDAKSYAKKPDGERLFVLMGDSHVTCFTGESRGEFFNCRRDDPSSARYVADEKRVVLGRFAADAASLPGARDWTFARLAFAAARPAEQMLVMSRMLYAGRKPDLVMVGIRWSGCTQSPLIRPEYLALLKDEGFAASFRETLRGLGAEPLKLPPAPPPHDVLLADKLDEKLGHSAGIDSDEDELVRAIIRDGDRGVDRLAGLTTFEYSHASCDRQLDYATYLLRALESAGVPRVCYLPPEQPQVIPEYNAEVAAAWLEPSVARIRDAAQATQCPLIDARAAVPAEHFGWNFIVRDPVHMDPGGHAALADFLFEEGKKRGFWRAMEATVNR